jgi:hypothetical protein
VLAPFLIISSDAKLAYRMRHWQPMHFVRTPFGKHSGTAGTKAYTGPNLYAPLSDWLCRSRQPSVEESANVVN